MSDELLPSSVSHFLVRYIDSVELLEVLLFVRKNRMRVVHVKELTDTLHSSAESITTRLRRLQEYGFLAKGELNQGGQYQSQSDELELQIDQVGEMYSKYRFRVINEIYKPKNREIREFADAFRIKKGDGDG